MLWVPNSDADKLYISQKEAIIAAKFLPLQPFPLFFLFFLLLKVALICEGLHDNRKEEVKQEEGPYDYHNREIDTCQDA
jgi:hypothetical protein